MSRVLWICGALVLMAGCNRPNWSTPVDAYRSFLRALSKGEAEVAFGALSTPTREVLSARAKELSKASGGGLRDNPASLFFVNAAEAAAVSEIKLLKEEGERAVLAVKAPGGVREVTMVKERDGWRIALDPSLIQGAAPQAPPPSAGASDAGTGIDDAR